MAGTQHPSVEVVFSNGQLKPLQDLGTAVCLKIGAASGGPSLTPRRCASLSDVLQFQHGPIVKSGSHQVGNSQPCYLMASKASVAGTMSSVTKVGAGAGPGTLALSLMSYTLHTQAAAGAALNLTTGWTKPPSPLPLKVTSGMGTNAHTQTVTYYDENDAVKTETLSISGAGDVTTTGRVKQVLTVVSNIDPGGTSDYSCAYAGPQDRYNCLVKFLLGGQINLGTAPQFQLSFDGGKSYSNTINMPSNGVHEMLSYGAGLTAQATGVKLTFSGGTVATSFWGCKRITGVDANGDVIYQAKATGVQVAHVVSGMNTALSVAVVGSVVTVNVATNGMGDPTSTATLVVAAIVASASASALVSATSVGTGGSVVGASAASTLNNGGVEYSAKTEGVRVRHLVSGTSTALSVSVSAKDVTINLATDANGIQTSTATLIAAAVSASSAASALLSATALGTGGGVAGSWAYASLLTSFVTGDIFAFTTTPPKWSNGDLYEALTAVKNNPDVLSNITVIHIVGEADATTKDYVQSALEGYAADNKQWKRAVLEAPRMGTTAEATWVTNVRAAFPTRSSNGLIAICTGESDHQNPAYGTYDEVNVATTYVARLMNCEISELPSHVECDTLRGTQYALPGLGSTIQKPGLGSPVAVNTGSNLYQTESTLVDLHSSNFVTLRTHPGLTGLFVRQGVQYVTDGDDYTYVTNARVADVAAQLAYQETLRFLNSNLLTDPTTGQLAEVECRKIEKNVKSRLFDELLGGKRAHVTAIDVLVDRATNFVANGTVFQTISMVGRTPATKFKTTLGFVRTL